MILFPIQTSVLLIVFLCVLEGTVLSQEQADASKPQHYKIIGQVTDEFEKPIPGAKAWLQFEFNEKSISAVTDRSGNFEILCPVNNENKAIHFWDLYLWVHASGHNLKCVRPQMESKEFLPCKVMLNREDWIVLIVHDENGRPCPHATVEPFYFDVPNGVFYSDQSTGLTSILPKDIAEEFRVTTDKNGEAEFQGIPIRQFKGAYCHTTGMVPQLFQFEGNGKLSFQLRPTGKVRGKVVCDESQLPVPDWTSKKVFVISQETQKAEQNNRLNQLIQEVSTPVQCHQFIELDREGCFELDGVLSGSLTVSLDLGNSELQPIPRTPNLLRSAGTSWLYADL